MVSNQLIDNNYKKEKKVAKKTVPKRNTQGKVGPKGSKNGWATHKHRKTRPS